MKDIIPRVLQAMSAHLSSAARRYSPSKSRRASRHRLLRLRFEPLEDRRLLAAINSTQAHIDEPSSPPMIELRVMPVVGGVSSPVVTTHAGDGSGRLFIAEQGGLVRIIRNGMLDPTPFLDISERVVAGGERGLLGLAFHPDYAASGAAGEGKFYVYYSAAATAGGDHDSVISEFRRSDDADIADAASERQLLRFSQPFSNHNGGDLKFGPDDGLLYISTGDGGSANDPQDNSQNLSNLLGAILRIDVNGDDFPADPARNYAIPPANPFVDDPDGRDEIFAYGLRNPFRMSFDDGPLGTATPDRLFVGDVGQGMFEEVDLVTAGGNYGWNVCEGDHVLGDFTEPCPAAFEPPIAEYGRDVGNSVIGGFVYRGSRFPSLQGRYLFGDLNGTLLALSENAGGFELSQPMVSGTKPSSIIGFGQDEAGELYVLTFSSVLAIEGIDPVIDFDFGDAPTSVQSGLESDYPTLLPDGARHVTGGGLRLGTAIDSEPDGQPTSNADGDGDDDDGVVPLASLVTTAAGATRSSVQVTASSSGKLDAWVDFNRDGDWLDAGEQIFTSRDVTAGANTLAFTVPAAATSGETYARFRLSSAGGLSPRGQAEDGEVEDYRLTILDGDAVGGACVLISASVSGVIQIAADGGDAVVSSVGGELFRGDGGSLASLDVLGTTGDDTLAIANLSSIFSGIIRADVAAGDDTLRFTGAGQSLDLTTIPDADLQGFETLDIIGSGANMLTLSAAEIINLSSTTDTIRVRHDEDDVIAYGAGWEVAKPEVRGGQFVHLLLQEGAVIEVVNTRAFQNPLDRFDVNRDGQVTPIDVLVNINTLNDDGARALPTPTSIDAASDFFYFDVNGDGFISPIDVLQVINLLNLQ